MNQERIARKLTAELSELQKKYREFFIKKMDDHGIGSPAELDEEGKKKFFNEIKADWAKEHKEAAKTAAVEDGDSPYCSMYFRGGALKWTMALGDGRQRSGSEPFKRAPVSSMRRLIDLFDRTGIDDSRCEIV